MHSVVSKPSIVLAAMLAACAPKAPPELEGRLDALEGRVAELEEAQTAEGPQRRAQGARDQADLEREAAALFRQLDEAMRESEYDKARALSSQLMADYADTRPARRAGRFHAQLQVIGEEAGELEVASWFQGEAAMDDGDVTMLVFWEEWCPHCTRYMPQLEEAWQRWGDDGLNVIALTKVTRNATDDSVRQFIEDHGLTYPVAKELNQSMSQRFSVRGVPAAAVIQDGEVIWRGHPGRLEDDDFAGWLAD